MNIDRRQPAKTRSSEATRAPKNPGAGMAQEVIASKLLGADSHETRRMIERTVLMAVEEHLKHNPKPYLKVLKEPPFKVDLDDPNAPGLANLTQRVLNLVNRRPEYRKLMEEARTEAIQARRPLGADYGAALYALIADATTDAIRQIAAEQEASRRRPEA